MTLSLLGFLLEPLWGQDLEPRRWTPLPLGMKVMGIGFGQTTGDLFFDPVLNVEDARVDMESVGLSYVHSFELLGKLARLDVLLSQQSATWEGLLDGEPARVDRSGFADPRIRLSFALLGAPPLEGRKMQTRLKEKKNHTVLGGAIAVNLPWGEYFEDKLLNIGQNRYTIRPQLGLVHTRGPWSYELTGSVFLYTDNDAFFAGTTREQDSLFAFQSHVVRVFKPGVWASLSAGYGWGAGSVVGGVAKDDERGDFLAAFSFGFPVSKTQGIKLAYVRARTQKELGGDTDTFGLAWSMRL